MAIQPVASLSLIKVKDRYTLDYGHLIYTSFLDEICKECMSVKENSSVKQQLVIFRSMLLSREHTH